MEVIALAGITRGSIIGGRYVISEIEHPWISEDPARGNVSTAIDGILDRPVRLYTAEAAQSADILDAARRVALLSEPRSPRILDVGSEGELTYVVVEETGGRPLSDILSHGPLRPEQARALVGEVAETLASSSSRGLHHGRLRPSNVDIDDKGRVYVRGIGIDTAAADGDALEGAPARQQDALSLVSLLYAACTGYWPAEQGIDGLEAAPVQGDAIAPPGDVTPGIPNDIDSLAAAVFGRVEDGPRTPAEVASYLGPWQNDELEAVFSKGIAAAGVPFRPNPIEEIPGLYVAAEEAAKAEAAGLAEPPPKQTPAQISAIIRNAASKTGDRVSGFTSRPGAKGLAAGIAADQGADAEDLDDALAMRSPSRFPLASGPSYHSTEPGGFYQAEDDSGVPPDAPAPAVTPRPARPQSKSAAPSAATNAAKTAAPSAARPAGSQARGKTPAQPVAPPVAPAKGKGAKNGQPVSPDTNPIKRAVKSGNPARAAAAKAALTAGLGPEETTSVLPAVGARSVGSGDGVPGKPSSAAMSEGGKPRRLAPSRIGALVVGALVIVGVVIALINLSSIGGDEEPTAQSPTASPTAKPAETKEPDEDKAEPEKTSPVFKKATSIDPGGDGKEYEERAKSVLLDKKGAWSTETYSSAEFGGLKKGLGLSLSLEEKTKVSAVKLKSNTKSGSFEIRASDDGEYKGSEVVGKGKFKDGTVEIEFDEPIETEHLIVWITKLGKSEGGYSAEISEVEPIGVG
ncbi:hypothetical protein LWF01_17170 [Saxibacter everestensis]|uniref:Protein kinase domain-containing protein n=1 Tax=Saxibacter everestensis TaxID=2909229 RepID=A0ABY8QS17_9MICO|nr:hypothetical protein LWF01_17170 [Brevibacteriaceae bacterium ZFBP1038]